MKCNRCGTKITKVQHFVVFYARGTNGLKETFVLCSACCPQFVEFMKAGKERGNN